ncbi:MAG: helix-turn-helix domain-containing protein [Desulfuromusa sp.]|nr:helix-turn-helix domain-containing protein [Desulfuromusa sp.]
MTIAYSDRGGWFSDYQSQTGAASCLSNMPKYLEVAARQIASLGTGAIVPNLNRLSLISTGVTTLSSHMKNGVCDTRILRTPVEDVQRIREFLSPAMSNIAKMLGVSRQAIYNWINGELPKVEHIERLHEIAVAADMLNESGIVLNGLLLKRKLTDGKNLYDLIAEGRSAQDSVQRLVLIVQREAIQKEILSSRFARRSKASTSADSDLIAENDGAL